ncbi:MAG TPA: cytochrome c [Acidobacteriaceae bacterium]|jgi:cytochrome c5|nr:cytochrome c [Acidobacteriaceae bacterium]
MNRRRIAYCLATGAALALAAPLIALQDRAQPPAHPTAQSAEHSATHRGTQPESQHAEQEGERVFNQNCARCHNAPDGFSPRITGTIVRHMRVRANLSRHDEQVLLQYFNP